MPDPSVYNTDGDQKSGGKCVIFHLNPGTDIMNGREEK
jgi:hypothetical protein